MHSRTGWSWGERNKKFNKLILLIIIICFCIALYKPCLKALPPLLPLITGPFHSLNHLSSLCSIQPVPPNMQRTKLNHGGRYRTTTRTISALTEHPLTPGWREAIIVKCLAQGHKCHNQDSNPHSAEQNQQSLNSELLSTRPRHPISVM